MVKQLEAEVSVSKCPICKRGLLRNISAGTFYSLVLTENGQVYAFGDNGYGQLGLGDTNNRLVPTSIPMLNNIMQISAGMDYSLVLAENGQEKALGRNKGGQLGLGDNKKRMAPK